MVGVYAIKPATCVQLFDDGGLLKKRRSTLLKNPGFTLDSKSDKKKFILIEKKGAESLFFNIKGSLGGLDVRPEANWFTL